MSIDFTCPRCNHEFHVPDDFAGGMGRCEKCGARVSIPVAAQRVARRENEKVPERNQYREPQHKIGRSWIRIGGAVFALLIVIVVCHQFLTYSKQKTFSQELAKQTQDAISLAEQYDKQYKFDKSLELLNEARASVERHEGTTAISLNLDLNDAIASTLRQKREFDSKIRAGYKLSEDGHFLSPRKQEEIRRRAQQRQFEAERLRASQYELATKALYRQLMADNQWELKMAIMLHHPLWSTAILKDAEGMGFFRRGRYLSDIKSNMRVWSVNLRHIGEDRYEATGSYLPSDEFPTSLTFRWVLKYQDGDIETISLE